jgi:membrane-associated phospholipid phosphatase
MSGRPLAWPSWERLATGITGALIVSAAFFPIYLGGAAIAGLRDQRLHLYAGFELAIPFWPFMIIPYLSMFVLFVMPPFQLDARELVHLVWRLVIASLVGGVIFLCLPSEIGFADRSDAGLWQAWYDRIYSIDGHFNAVPSFHVIYTASILLAMIEVATPRLRIGYGMWLILVCASTLLTHRHHLLDVASGLAVAFAVRAVARARMPASVQSPQVSR